MSDKKCVCDILPKDRCRVHDKNKAAGYDWANGYYNDNEEILGFEPFHKEVLEVAFEAGVESQSLTIRKMQVEIEELRKQRNIAIKQHCYRLAHQNYLQEASSEIGFKNNVSTADAEIEAKKAEVT